MLPPSHIPSVRPNDSPAGRAGQRHRFAAAKRLFPHRLVPTLTSFPVCNYNNVMTLEASGLHWIWDPAKNETNRQVHGLSFETASLVFNDPLAATIGDPYRHEQRWRTMGSVGTVIVMVGHTWPEMVLETGEEVGRTISARKATSHERRAYEEGTH